MLKHIRTMTQVGPEKEYAVGRLFESPEYVFVCATHPSMQHWAFSKRHGSDATTQLIPQTHTHTLVR